MVKLINNSKMPVYNILVPHWVPEYGALGCTKVDILAGKEVEITLPPAPQIDPISWVNYYAGLAYIGITAEGLDSIGGGDIKGKVIVNFKDELDNEVLTPKTFEGNVGTDFNITVDELGIDAPYEFVDVADEGSLTGKYTAEDITLTVNVNNTAPAAATVEFVDEDGDAVDAIDPLVVDGEVGDDFEITKEELDAHVEEPYEVTEDNDLPLEASSSSEELDSE